MVFFSPCLTLIHLRNGLNPSLTTSTRYRPWLSEIGTGTLPTSLPLILTAAPSVPAPGADSTVSCAGSGLRFSVKVKEAALRIFTLRVNGSWPANSRMKVYSPFSRRNTWGELPTGSACRVSR